MFTEAGDRRSGRALAVSEVHSHGHWNQKGSTSISDTPFAIEDVRTWSVSATCPKPPGPAPQGWEQNMNPGCLPPKLLPCALLRQVLRLTCLGKGLARKQGWGWGWDPGVPQAVGIGTPSLGTEPWCFLQALSGRVPTSLHGALA